MADKVDAPGCLLIRLGIRLPEVFVKLARFDVVAKGYLLTLLEHDPFSHGGCRVIVAMEVSQFRGPKLACRPCVLGQGIQGICHTARS